MQFLEEPYWLHKYIPVNRAPVPLLHYRLFFRGVYFFPSRISPEPFLRNTKKCLPIKWQMKPITYYIKWISDSVLSNFWFHANSRYRFFNCLPLPTLGYCMRLTDVVCGYTYEKDSFNKLFFIGLEWCYQSLPNWSLVGKDPIIVEYIQDIYLRPIILWFKFE